MVLIVRLVVGSYLVMQEINRAMGKGAQFRLFFGRPLEETDRKWTGKKGDAD